MGETNLARTWKMCIACVPSVDVPVFMTLVVGTPKHQFVQATTQFAAGSQLQPNLFPFMLSRYLGGNPFTELDAALFSGLTSLERLWVNGCALTSLPVGLFDGLTGLVQLFFHKNKLESLPTGLFGDDLDALHHLDLRENALVTLPAEIFQKLQALSTLNLSGNKISTLPAGLFPGRLEYLFLADNELSGQGALDPGAFEGLGRLLTLTLSNNELEALPSGLFSDLESLTVLGLAGNSDLQCVPSTVGSSSLADDKIILPVGFAFGGVCSCPGDEVCDDCVDGELGYICTGCGEKANECQLDRTCQECRLPANDQEQATWDACINQFAFGATCSAVSATACCFDELSANDCFRNDAFVTYSTCLAEALSENECTSLSCGDIETNAFSSSSSPSSEGTSGGVRFRNALVGCAVGSTVAGLVSVVGIFVWA